MNTSNFTPLDTQKIIKNHFPLEKKVFDVIFMLMGILTASVLIAVVYFIIQK